MTWETEEESDVHSQSHFTTDTYGYGDSIVWSDDPERAYYKSMMKGKEDSSLIGDATVNEMIEDRARDEANRSGKTNTNDARSGPGTENNTSASGKNQPGAEQTGRSSQQRSHKGRTDLTLDTSLLAIGRYPTPQTSNKSAQLVALNMKSPISALSPIDRAGDGKANTKNYAVPNPDIVPTSPGKRPVSADANQVIADLEGLDENGKIIPGYIFVTQGHSSAVQTRHSSKGRQSKNAQEKVKDVPSGERLDDDHRRRQRKFFLCKLGLVFLIAALAVAIAMMSIAFRTKRQSTSTSQNKLPDSGTIPTYRPVNAPTMPPNYFAPNPTNVPTSPPRRDTSGPTAATPGTTTPIVTTEAPTEIVTESPTARVTAAATPSPASSPIVGVTLQPTTAASTKNPTATPTMDVTSSPTASSTTGLNPDVEAAKVFIVSEFPESAAAFEDPTSPQSLAWEWFSKNLDGSKNRRVRRKLQVDMDWRLLQRWALAVFYFATGGRDVTIAEPGLHWKSRQGWLTVADECQWEFIACNDSRRVEEIVIQDNLLGGSIPPEMALFGGTMVRLSLNSNKIEGTLPTTLGRLKNMNRLTLSGNQIGGTIPSELGQLTALRILALSRNQISGMIPSELGNLANVRTLDFALVNLFGTIPTEFGLLSSLEFLSFGSTGISGTIPSEFGELPQLTDLRVARTNLVGEMPICGGVFGDRMIRADCREISCPCCTMCCFDGGSCSSATPMPTGEWTSDPTPMPTSAETNDPDPTITVANPPPTLSPTTEPVVVLPLATPSPTIETPAPTAKAIGTIISVPTGSNLTPTSCQASLSTEKSCYLSGEDIVISFDNCDARFGDWIGVYPSSQDLRSLGEPIAWIWTTGDPILQSPTDGGIVTFFEAQGAGSFVAVLARNSEGPPYEAYASSNIFSLAGTC